MLSSSTPKPTAQQEPLELLLCDPLHLEVVEYLLLLHPDPLASLTRGAVRLYLGRPVDVAVPPVEELLAFHELSDVDELVDHVEIQVPLVARPQVLELTTMLPVSSSTRRYPARGSMSTMRSASTFSVWSWNIDLTASTLSKPRKTSTKASDPVFAVLLMLWPEGAPPLPLALCHLGILPASFTKRSFR